MASKRLKASKTGEWHVGSNQTASYRWVLAPEPPRQRELEIIRGILIAVMTIIATGLVIWIFPA